MCVYACLSSYEGSVIGGLSFGTPIDTSCSPLASQSDGVEDTRYGSVNIIKKTEQERQPWQRDRSTKRKHDIGSSCGCTCANSETMMRLPDVNQERRDTQQCHCRQCGQVNSSGKRRCSVRILFPLYIIRSTCNECNNGCNIVEQKQRKANRNDSQKERQAF